MLLAESGQGLTDTERSLQTCQRITANEARLRCYDDAVRRHFFPVFRGDGNQRTAAFRIDEPTRIRYRSEHVIFVLYLKSTSGELIKNGHQGAPGESYLDVPESGDYFLEINASGAWKIWFESLAAK